eukprot:TRINITY_DN4582_c0_g2_i3.p2 TRINITY_DN4582_c0_g2~~TRINITY_DN4582_c0_g2_i3.p2  ORF type:complete len:131 (+),score=4.74 TRINITY_DN4582_c0_g2_i3:235-627(+)
MFTRYPAYYEVNAFFHWSGGYFQPQLFPQTRGFVSPSLRANFAAVPTAINVNDISQSRNYPNYFQINPVDAFRSQMPTTCVPVSKPKRVKCESPETVANPGRWSKEEHRRFLEGFLSAYRRCCPPWQRLA